MSKPKLSAALSRDFGRWLKEQRKSRRITQEFVAGKSGLTVTQISRIENGRSSTRRDTVIHLARIIGIDGREALRHFSPESFPQFPEELENIPFSEFTKHELKEIADFINFKLTQKRAAQQGETTGIEPPNRDQTPLEQPPENRLELPPEKESSEVPSYQVKNGKLTNGEKKESKNKEKGHTNQKPRK